jgi:amino acid adenylation domain-containing protein/non-ribosomal peptide synthase protein (TIGR01720 family)
MSKKNIEDIYSLSPVQQGMLFHSLSEPEAGVYVEQLVCTLYGDLDVAAFERAWVAVLARHAVLRTLFVWNRGEKPLQVVRRSVRLPFEQYDWRGLSQAEQERRLDALLEDDRRRGFNLSEAPLMRLALVHTGTERFNFLWSSHHLILDGWSLPLVLKEVFDFYEAFREGRELRLKPCSPFRDYVAWLKRQDLSQAEAYWRETLMGFTEPTPLMPDEQSIEESEHAGTAFAEQQEHLPRHLTDALQSLARQHHLTLSTLAQGAWALLLSRYSGESDVVFGVTVSGRAANLEGVESMVGLLINTLPLRVRVRGEEPLSSWLKEVQRRQGELIQYEYSPLAQVRSWSDVPRGTELFQSIHVFENYPLDPVLFGQHGGIRIADVRSLEQNNYPLTVAVVPGAEMSLHIAYDTRRFRAATIARMLGHMRSMLEGVVANPDRRVRELPWLTEAETSFLLRDCNRTRSVYAQERRVHELFEAQAERTPDAPALISGRERLTYGELDRRANQLTHYLRDLGVGSKVRVGVSLARSAELVVSLLAIWKAGGTYLPLDPAYPCGRLAHILADAQPEVLLTERRLLKTLPETRAQVVCLDAEREIISRQSVEPLCDKSETDGLAYVIYTSGSTGKPKGVMVGHRALGNHLQWMTDEFPLSESDRVLQKYSISFDTSVLEICYPLLCGAGLVFAEAGAEYDARYLLDLMERQGVTAIDVVPSTLKALADAGIERCRRLRQITCGGETLDPRLVERVRELSGEITLANMYGPTEVTIGATFHRCDGGASLKSVPIGRPIFNTEIYLLSHELTLVPVGVAGEIYIGGTGLAWGYLNRAGLTAERFLPNPFSEETGSRLYRTGDVGRYRADGSLEFLGRCDEQLKVRGFRIEPGEIETLLKRHPAIRDALVTAHEDDAGRRRLISYVLWHDGAEVSVGELRKFLQEELPEQLIPTVFVKLGEWPLTANGKIDRRALPPPDGARPRLEPDYLPPRNETERILAEIWSRALGLERVGVNDNFFELGGDSIISLQIVARAGQAGLVITPGQLFRHPTINALAQLADTTPAVRAEQGTVTGRVPLTPIQRWFFEQNPPEPHHYNQAVMLEVREGVDLDVLEEALGLLVAHHDALRMRFVEGESGWQQFNTASENQRILTQLDLSTAGSEEQATALEAAAKLAHVSLNLSEGPLVRALYFKVGSGKPGRLLILAHHLVVDAVSWRILLEDLDRTYTRLARHLKAELPPKTTSFKEWAEGLCEYAQSDAVRREMEYWTAETRRCIGALPADGDGEGSAKAAPAVSVFVSLSADETHNLLHGMAAVYHARVDEMLLSALALTLGRWAGNQRLLVDLEGHGREELCGGFDLSRTVGWFTTVFPVLLESGGAADELEALKIVKDQLRAIPGRGIGYGLLRYLSLDESIRERLQTMPQAEVSFNYLGNLDRTLDSSSTFVLVNEPVGPARSERAARSHAIEVEACIFEGQLHVEWAYCGQTHTRSTMERLATVFLAHLRTLAERRTAERARAYTPSDFPLAKLNQPRLGQIAAAGGLVQDIYPLTALQQGILFHELYRPRSGVYHTQLVCDINSHLDRGNFRRAWRAVVNRHAVLRTGFEWEALEEPLQVVRRDVSLRLDEEDWRGVCESERAARLETFLQTDRARGYKLDEAPLTRLKLFRTGDANYRLVWSCHHLLVDGWSLAILLKEFLDYYEALCRGEAIEWTAEQPYRVYIEWLTRRDEKAAEAYWREALRGIRQPTRLGVERGDEDAEEATATARGEQTFRLSRDLTEQLRCLARTSGLTLNTLMRGAWAILLSRYSRETDVLFGVVVSGRPGELPGVEEMVGMFINTLPLRVKVERAARLMDWMAGLQARQAEMQPFEYNSLAQVQGWSEVTGGVPLFESLLVFENYPVDSFVEAWLEGRAGSLEISNLRAIEATNYPLALVVAPGEELKISAAYERGRFDDETITRLLGHFESLLEAVASNPNRRIAEFSLLNRRERHQLLFEWAGADTAYPADRGIHALFEAQAEQTPDAVAVRFGGRRLTYLELNRRANRLARHLSKIGVGPETRVGISLERDVEMVVGLLGILKAGGAYVPLDPEYPRERLGFMLRDSQAAVLLTRRKFAESLPEHGARVICLDAELEAFANENEQNLSTEVSGDNLAYVMYTSGSTGRPKGVCVPHRAISRLVCNTNYTVLDSQSRIAQVSNSSFDAATFEIWGALLHGAELVGVAAEAILSPQDFVAQLSTRGINQLFMTTALFNQTADEFPAGFRSLDTLLLGGEAVDPRRVREVLAAGPPRRLLHVYGPTETTTFATWHEVKDVPPEATTVPVGRPISNTKVYVLDEGFEPVPVGVPGHLHIGGEGVARGYHEQPALTAENFRPDPFSRKPGQRLYRTGDIARYLPDGNLEFLGRLDEQVKIRGFRIEPGEIESELRRHPAVQEALILTREEAGRDRHLVAYVVPKQQPAPASGELLAFLSMRLPAYMLPSSFVTLEGLPLTPNGKVDRTQLPAPDHARPLLEETFAAAGTLVQDVLCGIWAELLCLERVGIHDNFFDLGGHSLLATRLVSKIRHVFQVEMPLRTLFDRPTVAGVSSHLEQALREQSGLQPQPLLPAARDEKLPLSFAQQRLWFLDQLEPSSSAYNIPAALHIKGVLKVGILTRCFNEIIRRHESLRTTFPVVGGSPVQKIAPALELEMPLVNLSILSDAERQIRIQRLMTEEAGRPFDLTRGPLLRALLLRLAEDEHVLLLTAHHISADGWSVKVFMREMATLYEAYSHERPAPLPELPIQYADFSIWQRLYLTGDVLAAQLAYWKRQLGGDLPVLSLPADRLRPHTRTFRGATESLRLSAELSEAVRSLSRRHHATLFMTLLAAFKVLLSRYTGQQDILVGTPVANRNYQELEDLIGFFVNTQVLRTEVSGEQSFQELLDRVKKIALDAYAHQDVPFERLIEELQPSRSLSHTPLFQVMFVLQNDPPPSIDLPGLELTSMEVESRTAKFDLTMMVEEAGAELAVSLEYSTDLFRAETIRRTLRHFRTLLEGIVADPGKRLAELPLLAAAERPEILALCRPRSTRPAPEACLHRLFERRAEQSPQAVALSCDGLRISYADLNRRANQLAHYLQALGVGPETPVALYLERSPEMIVAVLAVLKAGGAYVPLDPAWPRQRLAFIVEDTRAALLLTESSLADGLPVTGAQVICLDRQRRDIGRHSAQDCQSTVGAGNTAYVIYTSGSTGEPKGVLVTHANVARLFASTEDYFRFGADDCWTLFHSYAFDFSVWELWGALLYGGRLVVVSHLTSRSPEEFYRLLRRERVTVLSQTPSAFRQLSGVDERTADVDEPEPSSLRVVVFGGEALDVRDLGAWVERHGDECPRLVNMYGITETTVHVTLRRITLADVRQAEAGELGSVIGEAIDDLEVYVLDERMEVVPVGVAGEMWVGGAGLARGYLRRADLTAERFVPHPYALRAGERLYRTGDVGRRLDDGELEYLGRADEQLKVRGFRIEPGEIEAALRQHESVEQARVLARDGGGAEKRLVGYVKRKIGMEVSRAELREHLRARLPEYMLPAAFVVLDDFPLTANGKLNLRALAETDDPPQETGAGYVEPQTEIEKTIAAVWCAILQLERVGVRDNFFDLGGTSISMALACHRLREVLQKEISMLEMFTYTTVNSLARHLAHAEFEGAIQPLDSKAVEARRETMHWRKKFRKEQRMGLDQ